METPVSEKKWEYESRVSTGRPVSMNPQKPKTKIKMRVSKEVQRDEYRMNVRDWLQEFKAICLTASTGQKGFGET